MDPRYNGWPPQEGYGGQYAPPPAQQNGYPPNVYPAQYHPQQIAHQYSQSQHMPGQPRVLIPPRASPQQYAPVQPDGMAQQRAQQPQVVIPGRNGGVGFGSSPMGNMAPPRIRQVQAPVQRMAQVQRASSDNQGQPALQTHPPTTKPLQRAVSSQENIHHPQQRTPTQPTPHQSLQRAPLQPQSTPQQQRTQSYQSPSSQHRAHPPPHTPASQGRVQPQVVIKKAAHTQSTSPLPPSKSLPVDLTLLLLSAADEYINAARSLGPLAALTQRQADLEQYYKLMSTGLGCMEAVLKRYNQPPRDEANLRLRFAALLIEETDNDVEIEDVISKGIALCQRSRLPDLRYSMQHLHARYQFKSNHRAALRSLDGPISEAETFQHIVWVYAFRFLKVSFAMQVSGRPETASALQQLHAIINHAEKRGDRAIFVTASTLEAMIYLRTSAPDHIENAQRAIAAARSYQLEASSKQLGQIAVLIDSIDMACSIQQGKPDPQKMSALQHKVDQESGPENGFFSVLVEKSFGGNMTLCTGDIFRKAEDGRDELVFSWLPQNDVKTLAYYLSGLTTVPKETNRGINYFQEGFRITQHTVQHPSSAAMSIPASIQQRNWVVVLDWHLRFTLGLLACRADDIPHSEKALESLRARLQHPPFKDVDTFTRLTSYLSAVIAQSQGSLDQAAQEYSTLDLSQPAPSVHGGLKTDVAILAIMNRTLILRDPRHPQHYLVADLFSQLEPLCNNHPNIYIKAALQIIRAFINADSSINRQKTLTHNALSTSQNLQNYQFIAMCLNYMTARFFADTVGEKAVKSVRAARSVAKQSRSVLWRAVAYGLCIYTFQKNGLLEDAAQCQQGFDELVNRLPPSLVSTIQGRSRQSVTSGFNNVEMMG